MTLRPILAVSIAATLSGCATTLPTAGPTWGALQRTDRFTDQQSCRVTLIAAVRMDALRPVLRYYPYVERRGAEVRVGLMAHPSMPMPVGAIQLRIDDLPAWSIGTSETPIDSVVITAQQLTAQLPSVSDPAQAEAMRRSAEAMSATMTRSASPYTATTGEKARDILNQLRSGARLIYRTTGANASSTTGEAPLGPEFIQALQECGL